jgi:transcriptional regulator with XRE-family HTH domain
MDIRRQVGRNLRRLRRARDVSQEALALEAEVARSYMSALERGKRNPTVLVLERLAWALGTTVAAIVTPEPEVAPLKRSGLKPKRKGRKPGRAR